MFYSLLIFKHFLNDRHPKPCFWNLHRSCVPLYTCHFIFEAIPFHLILFCSVHIFIPNIYCTHNCINTGWNKSYVVISLFYTSFMITYFIYNISILSVHKIWKKINFILQFNDRQSVLFVKTVWGLCANNQAYQVFGKMFKVISCTEYFVYRWCTLCYGCLLSARLRI